MHDLVPDMAHKRAEICPDRIAFSESGRDWSFADCNRAADAIADAFAAQGLVEGDRIAILCQNRIEFFLTLFACQKTGVILCPLNWRQPVAELKDTLVPICVKAILTEAEFSNTGAALAEELGFTHYRIETELTNWIGQPATARNAMIPADRPWYLLFTSGTTGQPKAVIQTAKMAWANAVNIGQAVDLTSRDASVNFLPLFHTAGINLYTLPVFLFGGRSIILRKFDSETLLKLLEKGQISQFFGVPAIYQAFSLASDVDTVDWSEIKCGCGGAPLPEPLIHFFAERGAFVLNGFGMTETGPTTFLMDPGHAATKIGSVGRAQMLTECRLDGVSGEGEGEIQLKGPNITPGYFENPEATADSFTEDGWLKTGDIGRRDSDGYMYIVDRIKDMYISGGENVYPAEVERVLVHFPGVLECAVIGVPDAKWGEVGAAFLMPRPGERIETEQLLSWCRERLATYKVPAHVSVVEDFPRTAAGKIRKPELRGLIA